MNKQYLAAIIFLLGFAIFQSAYAKVVVEEVQGNCAYCTHTAYFENADDISPRPALSTPIVTPSGAHIERIDDPKRGLLTKDSSGLLWTTTLVAVRPIIDDKVKNEHQYPMQALRSCKKIGARLPTLKEYKELAKLFVANGKYDAGAAAKILDPSGPGIRYLTEVNKIENGVAYSKQFELFGSGLQWSPDLAGYPSEYGGDWKDQSLVKCVIPPDMLVSTDYKQKFEALEMPKMNSCEASQFAGDWNPEEVVCYNPENPSEREPSMPNIKFRGFAKDTRKISGGPLFLVGVYNNNYRFMRSRNGGNYFWSEPIGWTGSAGNEAYLDLITKVRKDKKGCDVFRVEVLSDDEKAKGVTPAKPELLFTAGINAKDGSMVVHPSNEKLLSVCVPNGKGNLRQAIRLKNSRASQ